MSRKQHREDRVWEIAKSRASTKEAKEAVAMVETYCDPDVRRALVFLLESTANLKKVRDMPESINELAYPLDHYIRLQYAGRSKPPSERTVKIHRVKCTETDGGLSLKSFVATDGTGPAKTFLFSGVLAAWDADTGEVIDDFRQFVAAVIEEG